MSENRLRREVIAGSLGRRAGVSIVGTASALSEAVALVRTLEVDLVVLDDDGNESDARRRIDAIKGACPTIRALLLSTGNRVQRTAGVGYVSHDTSFVEIIDAIQALCRGGAPDPPRVNSRTPRSAFSHAGDLRKPLTPREYELLRLVERGLSNQEAAQELKISIYTVKNHMHNIFEKLLVHRRLEAVRCASRASMMKDSLHVVSFLG
jgi:DNA-binding NarL/FixJ family response regulator